MWLRQGGTEQVLFWSTSYLKIPRCQWMKLHAMLLFTLFSFKPGGLYFGSSRCNMTFKRRSEKEFYSAFNRLGHYLSSSKLSAQLDGHLKFCGWWHRVNHDQNKFSFMSIFYMQCIASLTPQTDKNISASIFPGIFYETPSVPMQRDWTLEPDEFTSFKPHYFSLHQNFLLLPTFSSQGILHAGPELWHQ